ncbi:hypothetical protein EST38_g3677 [Candolleomyces aberdarensis]|uniref:Cytochrome P450 n=1 Tax=Candolleomyces aberdarensis TaxID=2316362 RepID=A0A4Q2DSG0_9AGAR|nr:hypothetical protein EST38_g3677 [Candolleomyces aberdarensis]
MWDSPFIPFSLGIAFVYFVRSVVAQRKRNPRGLPLPPGPKGLPVLGNVFQFPKALPWEAYDKLCKEHGDIIYMTALGQGVLVLGSQRRAVDLLEKRAANYSDRPPFPVIEMMGLGWSFGLMRYGAVWRQYRRAFHKFFNNNAIPTWHPIMYEEVKGFLRKVQSQPDGIFEHVQLMFGTLIMRVAYGFDDIRQNEALIHNAEALIQGFHKAAAPGRYLVNSFPSLRHVPAWFPGAGFKRHLEALSQMSFNTIHHPFEEAKLDYAHGKKGQHPSMAASFIDSISEESDGIREEMEDVARGVCGIAYLGGAETSVSSGLALIYALGSHPEVQTKAQTEIDSFVGPDRLPTMDDIKDLPYVRAIVKELNRWFTILPLGLAHSNTEDDEYDGYFIPKGTIILTNNWATMHNPDVFDSPFEFFPDRYLKDGKIDDSVTDAEVAAFGHGRRLCPGRDFANDALFLMVASLLATFTVGTPKDEEGNVIPTLRLEPMNPSASKILPFKCEFHLRPGREHFLQ